MKTFNSIKDLKLYLNEDTNTYVFDEGIRFNFNLITTANIKACNIDALDITAGDIDAYNIEAHNIKALDITACDIKALDITALNINAGDIKVGEIKARNVSYYAFCIAYQSFACVSVKGRRHNSSHKCLDGDIIIRKEVE